MMARTLVSVLELELEPVPELELVLVPELELQLNTAPRQPAFVEPLCD